MCVQDSDCIPTLICPILAGVCTCPQYLPDLACNCAATKYYDSSSSQCSKNILEIDLFFSLSLFLIVNRATLGGSCTTSANYTCLASLYCNAGTCACPTGTTWDSCKFNLYG